MSPGTDGEVQSKFDVEVVICFAIFLANVITSFFVPRSNPINDRYRRFFCENVFFFSFNRIGFILFRKVLSLSCIRTRILFTWQLFLFSYCLMNNYFLLFFIIGHCGSFFCFYIKYLF